MKTKTIDINNYRIDSHALAHRITARISRIIESEAIEGNTKGYGVKRRINKLRAFKLSLMK
jgi:hypothetical protein